MIYSGVDDNWLRVELLHSLCSDYYYLTEGKECFEIKPDSKFFFDTRLHDNIQKEASVVGMIATWSVVTLEALANQALAETIKCPKAVKKAIEHPRQYHQCKAGSELATKIDILSSSGSTTGSMKQLAEELCDLRNLIVHDKPFNYTDLGDGEVKIDHYRLRGEPLNKQLRYPDLRQIFESCDQVRVFLLQTFDSEHLAIHENSFLALLETNKALQRTSR